MTPVVGILTRPQDFRLSAAEVAVVFSIPLAVVLEDHARHTWKDISWELPGSPSPAWCRVHFFDIGGQNVWGLTAAMLLELAEQGYQRQAAFPVNIPGAPSIRHRVNKQGQLNQVATSQTARHVPV